MSLYAQAASSAITAISGTETDRVYDESYNVAITAYAKEQALLNNINAAQRNIAAINQDKILTNTKIQMNQSQAEAANIIAAATAGVEGGSVDDIQYSTEANEAFALNSAKQSANQEIENQLASIGSDTSALIATDVDLPKYNYLDDLMGAFSSLEKSDFETSEALDSQGTSLNSLWSG